MRWTSAAFAGTSAALSRTREGDGRRSAALFCITIPLPGTSAPDDLQQKPAALQQKSSAQELTKSALQQKSASRQLGSAFPVARERCFAAKQTGRVSGQRFSDANERCFAAEQRCRASGRDCFDAKHIHRLSRRLKSDSSDAALVARELHSRAGCLWRFRGMPHRPLPDPPPLRGRGRHRPSALS